MKNTSIIEFLTKGYALDLVISILVGFGLYSLYFNVISELLGLLTGGLGISDKFLPLGSAPDGLTVTTVEQAREIGLPIVTYGSFLYDAWYLFIIGLCAWVSLRLFNRAVTRREASVLEHQAE